MSIEQGGDGRWLITCHAGCGVDAILAAAHLERRDLSRRRLADKGTLGWEVGAVGGSWFVGRRRSTHEPAGYAIDSTGPEASICWTKEESQGREEAGREEEGEGETVIRPDERKCPIHGGFLKQQSRRVEPPGMILQDPVPESLYGCLEEGRTFRLEVCPHDAEVLEYVDSGGGGGVYEPGETLDDQGKAHRFRCHGCKRMFMRTFGDLIETHTT